MWFIVSLFSSIADSLKYILGKKGTSKTDPFIVGWSQWFFGFFIFLPVLINNPPKIIPTDFWIIVVLNSFINAAATVLFWQGLKISDLSLAIPLVNFIPIFVLLISPFMSGELPTLLGIVGVIIVTIGTYFVNLDQKVNYFWQPIQSVFYQKGQRLVLIVTLIWSISSILDKKAVMLTSPLFYLSSFYLLTMLMLLPILIIRHKKNIKRSVLLPLAGMGIIGGLAHLTQYYAVTLTLVSYVVAVKSSSVLFTIILGYFLFKEKNIKQRMAGSIVMLIGVLIIIFYG